MNEINLMTGLVSGIVLIIVSGFGYMIFYSIKEIKNDIKEMLAASDKKISILEQEQKDINKSLTKLETLMPTLLSSNESINTAHYEIMKKTIDMSSKIIEKLRFISNTD